MLKISIRLLIILFLTIVSLKSALTETYECSENAIDNEAKLGVHKGNAVTITEDESAKECLFSVNGAKVGSPPQEKILIGFNSLITGQIVRDLKEKRIQSLAYALLASAQVEEIPNSMRTALINNSQNLTSCFAEFLSGRIPNGFRKNSVICRVWQPKDDGRVNVTIPTLEISVMWDGIRSRLFLPQAYRHGRPFNW